MSDFSRGEIEAHFKRWREAVDRRDLGSMAEMLALRASGGNASYGMFEGRDAIVKCMQHWPENVPNRSIWHVIDGTRVVNKWRETLPGTPPSHRGYRDYDYVGISEFLYGGDGQWSFMFGLPDQAGLLRVYAEWRADGQAEIYGEVYPGIPA